MHGFEWRDAWTLEHFAQILGSRRLESCCPTDPGTFLLIVSPYLRVQCMERARNPRVLSARLRSLTLLTDCMANSCPGRASLHVSSTFLALFSPPRLIFNHLGAEKQPKTHLEARGSWFLRFDLFDAKQQEGIGQYVAEFSHVSFSAMSNSFNGNARRCIKTDGLHG